MNDGPFLSASAPLCFQSCYECLHMQLETRFAATPHSHQLSRLVDRPENASRLQSWRFCKLELVVFYTFFRSKLGPQ